jgi:hypothetical protein
MTDHHQELENEIRKQSHLLALAWRKGQAPKVLDALAEVEPMARSLMAILIHDQLTRWSPYDCRWPMSFWRAVLDRSMMGIAGRQLKALGSEYRERFGSDPPPLTRSDTKQHDPEESTRRVAYQAETIRRALETGAPLVPARPPERAPDQFLRRSQEGAR